jgi:homoserine O-succinyltransferase
MSFVGQKGDVPHHPANGDRLVIGLLNNMSGRALKPTEGLFVELLHAAARQVDIEIRYYSRGAAPCAAPPLGAFATPYASIDEILAAPMAARPVDAMIVTGMAPRTADLRDEPVWCDVVRLADWAEERAVPVLWSCLAAHAVLLHLDGIRRVRLPRKLSGVYACEKVAGNHPLMAGLPAAWHTPHSRFNGVPESSLVAHGYEILSRSAEAGVDIFARQGTALSVFSQGHPEYHADTLKREYKRDVRNYFAGESDDYPYVPDAYLDSDTEDRLTRLRERVLRGGRDPAWLEAVVSVLDAAPCDAGWRQQATRFYANWLTHVMRGKRAVSRFAVAPQDMPLAIATPEPEGARGVTSA